MDFVEKQGSHRRVLEHFVVTHQFKMATFGQICALIIALACVIAACYCAHINQPWPASVLGGATVVGAITAFVRGKKEREDGFSAKE